MGLLNFGDKVRFITAISFLKLILPKRSEKLAQRCFPLLVRIRRNVPNCNLTHDFSYGYYDLCFIHVSLEGTIHSERWEGSL